MIKEKIHNHTFSIVAYKTSPFLEECIESLLNQTLKSKIIICTSTYSINMEKIAEKYKIKVHINHRKENIVSDWNYALNEANTPFVTLVHQDDIYHPEFLEKTMSRLSQGNLITFTNYVEQSGPIIQSSKLILVKSLLLLPFLFNNTIKSNFCKRSMLLFGNPICCPTVTYNMDKLRNFRFDERFTNNMDWNAWLELAERKGSFVYIMEKLLIHRIHKDSVTSQSIKNKEKIIEDRQIFNKLWFYPLNIIFSKIYASSYSRYYYQK